MQGNTRAIRYGAAVLIVMAGLPSCSTLAKSTEAADTSSANSHTGQIFVHPDSYVCASVNLPQELWPEPLDSYGGTGLSNYLVNRLRKEFKDIGKLGNAMRFRVDDDNREPLCRGTSSVHVKIRYTKIKEGVFRSYASVLKQNGAAYLENIIDIDEDIKSGKLSLAEGDNAYQRSIYSDINYKAERMLGFFSFEK